MWQPERIHVSMYLVQPKYSDEYDSNRRILIKDKCALLKGLMESGGAWLLLQRRALNKITGRGRRRPPALPSVLCGYSSFVSSLFLCGPRVSFLCFAGMVITLTRPITSQKSNEFFTNHRLPYLPLHVFLRTSSSTLATLLMDPSVMMKIWRGNERCMGCWYTQESAPSRLVPRMSALILWTYSYACIRVTCVHTCTYTIERERERERKCTVGS